MTNPDITTDTGNENLDPNNLVNSQRKSVWDRVGNAIHGSVNKGGEIVHFGAEVSRTGTHHGKEFAGPAGEALGNIIGGTGRLVMGVVRGIRGKTKLDTKEHK